MPPESPVKILFVGDMHLGRSASRVPVNAPELGEFSAQDISPLGAWRRVVQAAMAEEVQAVALAGDLVHQDDDLFEARAHLERGIRQLNDAGIDVVAVAGNHDTRVLPALAATIDGLHLLGPGGTWSAFTVSENVRLVGWSFPARHHTTSPLQDSSPPSVEPGVVTLGLLHADLDTARSNYAPVSRTTLTAVGYQGWALGHVHAPDPVPEPRAPGRPFYLGSISGATPNETGAHGPVLATVSTAGDVTWQRRVLAPLRWEHRDVALDDLAVAENQNLGTALRNHLLQWVSRLDPGSAWRDQDAHALGLRLTLTGAHPQADALQRAAAGFGREELVTMVDGCVVFIEKLISEVTVPVDLAQLARRSDPPGLVAREIIALQDRDPASAPLLVQARLAVAQVAAPAGLDVDDWNDDELRAHLIQAGRRALNALLAQDGGHAS